MHKKIEQPVSSYTEFEELAWLSSKAIPKVGEKINVRVNSIGESIVQKYFVEYGFIGLLVQPTNPPDWYLKQNDGNPPCHVFPAEVEELVDREAMRENHKKVLTSTS